MRPLGIARLASVFLLFGAACFGAACKPGASAEPSASASAPASSPPPGEGAPAAAPGEKATLGAPAPDFTLPDTEGKPVSLSSFKGKVVVLEWFNPECPFVRANHEKGPLKNLAKRLEGGGEVVWLAVNSNAAGKQGHGADKNREAKARFGMGHPVLLDERGEVGRAYGAKTTPHMFVVDRQGVLVYRGAVDNQPGSDPEPDEKLESYVDAAVADLLAGRPVSLKETEAYGCSVKYLAP